MKIDATSATALSKQLWKSLEVMKQNGVALGHMEKTRLLYQKQFNTGAAIKVVPGRTAEKMGWRNFDKIVEFSGRSVSSAEDLAGILFALDITPNAPETVNVKLKQKDGIREYKVRTKQKLGFMY